MRRKLRPHADVIGRHGFALIFALGILASLAPLGLTFVARARSEAASGAAYLDTVRARMLACAGIDRAIAELRARTGTAACDSTAGGWTCGDPPSTPPASLAAPSFAAAGTVYGRAVSGELAGTHEPRGDTYTLRVADAASRLYINGRQPALAAMLDHLGAAIEMEGLGANPCPPGTGARLVAARDARPGRVFACKDEVAAILGTAAWRALRPYVTEIAWVDASVIEPRAQTPLDWAYGPIPEELTWQTAVQATGAGRAPVNINTAPTPVLIAVLAGLQGMFLDARLQRAPVNGSNLERIHWRRALSAPIDLNTAHALARRIAADRAAAPFRSWQQFRDYVDALLPAGGPDTPHVHAELIRAMGNPNTLLNKFNPDAVVTNWIGKEDLTFVTTEFCFGSMGVFEIESLGRVTTGGGREVATHLTRVGVKIFDTLRHTTQMDFTTAAVLGAGAGTTRTLPENLDDHAVPSDLDGQVVPRELAAAGGTFTANYDDTLLGTDRFRRTDFFGVADCVEGRSVFAPTSRQASDLFPDGCFYSSARSKVLHYSTQGHLNSREGTLEFWIKEHRLAHKGAMRGLVYGWVIGTPRHAYRLSLNNTYRYGMDMGWACFPFPSGFHAGTRYPPQGSVSPEEHYLIWATTLSFESLGGGEWHHLAACWRNYGVISLYLDGKQLFETTLPQNEAWGWTAPGVTDDLQIGSYVHPAYYETLPGVPWQTPAQLAVNRFAEATIDGVRTSATARYATSFPSPDRYPRTQGDTAWVADARLPIGLDPVVRVTGVSCTTYRPCTRGGRAIPTSQQPSVALQWWDGDANAWSPEVGDAGAPVNRWVTRGEALRYRARWFDNGLTPNHATAILDDVSVYFQGPVEHLIHAEYEN